MKAREMDLRHGFREERSGGGGELLVKGGLELFQGLHGVVGSLPVNGKLQPARCV